MNTNNDSLIMLMGRARLMGVAIATLILGSGGDADAGQQELPTFGDLPIGKVTAPLDAAKEKPPASIPAGESVAGFRVLPAQYPGGPTQITSDQVAASYTPSTSTGMPMVYDGVSGCYSQRFASALASTLQSDLAFGVAAIRPFEWEQGLGWQASIYAGSGAKLLALVHGERVVDPDSQSPTLESTDAWFDASTKGFRLVGKASLPLRQVGAAPGGLRIFAGRDDRSDGRRFVHFIVSRAKETPYQQIVSTMLTRGENTTSAGACGHSRLSLLARREGDSGVIQLTTVLPELKPGEHSSATPLPPLPATSTAKTKELRTRQLRVQFSVSQTSRDKEPILSVTPTWSGPEVLQRVFLPTPQPVASPVVTPTHPKSVAKKPR